LEGAILGLISCSQFEQGISRKRVSKQMPEGNVNHQCPWISDFFLAKNRQLATQFSENRIFCRKFSAKKISPKTTENWFFVDGAPHLCLLATVFRVS
jgi:hypothetical protein